ncbi:hypothetical protein HA466_0319790 [Hirschfeldia incana]|nr:hypothetical protein HA466_0319790 [Hirschfeldia incana]
MFVMLGQMLHRDYIDAAQEKVEGDANDIEFHGSKVAVEYGLVRASWDEVVSSKGYVTLTLTNGPEYHISQITVAVMVAKHLGATLVLPDIRGSKPGDEMNFEDIYDVDKLVKSLESVVKVVKKLPSHVSLRDIAIVKVPTRVAAAYIKEHIDPIFRSKGNIRVTTYFPSVNLRKTSLDGEKADPVSCLAMFGSLELQPGKICRETGAVVGSKTCYNAQEIALFLRKLGFESDTAIYLTQPRWESSLNILKDIFLKTFTKEEIMPASKKSNSRSDVFVPAIPGLFYANTVGKRIALGKPQVLVPAEISGTSGLSTDYISPYISRKNHLAYSCFC